jgi:hypothetical protein
MSGMYILKRTFFLAFLFLPALFTKAQPDTCHLRISLLTCSPGGDLYSIWGHTGIRMTDSVKEFDVVFNYGTFDDADPLFYVKFTRGIMIYSLSVWSFSDFMQEYEYEHRSVAEQVLQLSCTEKNQLAAALVENSKEPNRNYGYHFYQDNCTTRARDIILKNAGGPVAIKNILPPGGHSFRQLIHTYLDKGGQYWSKLGIDILLGGNLDKTADNMQAMFLPDYLLKAFDSTTTSKGQPLVVSNTVILKASPKARSTGILFTPLLVFTLLLLIIAALSFSKAARAQTLLKIVDTTLFTVLGLLGALLLTLWIVRVDTVCRNNFNLLWALPTHIVFVFFMYRRYKWVAVYYKITIALLVLLLLGWAWLPQQMNNALLPVVALLLLRSIVRLKKIKA